MLILYGIEQENSSFTLQQCQRISETIEQKYKSKIAICKAFHGCCYACGSFQTVKITRAVEHDNGPPVQADVSNHNPHAKAGNQHNSIFCVEGIIENIFKLKNNKACGLDNIRNEYLKHAPQSLIAFICDSFKPILETGLIPKVWCQGLFMLLYKNKGDRYDPNNYGVITLLSFLNKLFTSCLSTRISKFLFENDKIGNEQAGFRPDFSNVAYLYAACNNWLLQMKKSYILCFCWLP